MFSSMNLIPHFISLSANSNSIYLLISLNPFQASLHLYPWHSLAKSENTFQSIRNTIWWINLPGTLKFTTSFESTIIGDLYPQLYTCNDQHHSNAWLMRKTEKKNFKPRWRWDGCLAKPCNIYYGCCSIIVLTLIWIPKAIPNEFKVIKVSWYLMM